MGCLGFLPSGAVMLVYDAEGEAVYVDRILYNRGDFYMLLGR